MAEGDDYPDCFDPYLRYAISTEFKDFESFDEEKHRLFFLVEFKRGGQATSFVEAMRPMKDGSSIELGPVFDNTPYVTMRSDKSVVLDSDAVPVWENYVSRIELSLPLKPGVLAIERVISRGEETKPPPALLIGVIDDGCPFAAAHFLRNPAGAPASTRVRALWDQNQSHLPVQVNGLDFFGQVPDDFTYGLEFLRETKSGQIGLDDWIRMHATPTGSIDEDGCYADAGFETLRRRASHGAHVMDVLAGRFPTSARVGPSRPGQDRRDPPSWAAGTDPASDADVVFVQFPESGIRDATGVWLKAYVLDGIRYILSFADPNITKNAIINISYGPTTGPHDGTAVLEAALAALVAEFDGVNRQPKLEIVLAAGNSYGSDGHVFFERKDALPQQIEWTWRLPPDNSVLCFAEIWMDHTEAGNVAVTLTSPAGIAVTSTGGVAAAPAGGVPPPTGASPQVSGPIRWRDNIVWVLAVRPTIAGAAEHGDYTIKVAGIGRNAKVHAYVARSDPNMGVRTGARRSYFVDHNWEQTRSAEAGYSLTGGEFDVTGSLVDRYGTLNGIATAQPGRVNVAGGYVLADGRKSPYSSAGPSRRGVRIGPDYALLCDESYALGGIRAGGNRSGSVFRLRGTSAAAPQLGRHLANLATGLQFPPASKVPTDFREEWKRGRGNIEPP